jgi:hypothetical protein
MKGDSTIIIILLIILAVIIIGNKIVSKNNTPSLPSNLKGAAGLDYLKKQYGSYLSQAQSLCVSQFKGNWVDTSNSIGCYGMNGFSIAYCSMDAIHNLENACSSIGGSAACSISEVSCTV